VGKIGKGRGRGSGVEELMKRQEHYFPQQSNRRRRNDEEKSTRWIKSVLSDSSNAWSSCICILQSVNSVGVTQSSSLLFQNRLMKKTDRHRLTQLVHLKTAVQTEMMAKQFSRIR